jgi:hypothetical protein
MPIPIQRDSLTTTLENRYNNQKAGGAFNAKNIVTSDDTISPLVGKPSDKGAQYSIDKGGFRVKQPVGLSDLADVPDRKNSTSKQLSAYTQGLSNKKYKP